MKSVLEFLTDLALHNDREWFHANRQRYESARDKMLFMTEVFISEIRKFDTELPFMNPAECLFRIYRDTRFSADKSPYKTYFGSYMAKGGRKSDLAGYYFHVQPGESFVAGGIWSPEAPVLKAIRLAIYDHPEEYLSIIRDPGFNRYFKEMEGERLKMAPKGFPPDFQHINLLKYKSYSFSWNLGDEALTGENLVESVIGAYREMHRVNRFLNDAVDKYLEE